jgi:hypothetical protein
MKSALSLIVLSLALLGFSISLEPFTTSPDGTYPFHGVAQGDSQAYHAARGQALTPKYRLQDYGATVLVLGLVVAILRWRPLNAPGSKLGFISLAVIAPTLTAVGFVFDLVQGQSRWEFPPWADSLGIPLMGVPVMLLLGLAWAFAHFIFLAGVPRRAGVPISYIAVRQGNPWLHVICCLTALLILGMIFDGAYWYAVPGMLWLYFYASISAVRRHDA